jgi:hypothetical protein
LKDDEARLLHLTHLFHLRDNKSAREFGIATEEYFNNWRTPLEGSFVTNEYKNRMNGIRNENIICTVMKTDRIEYGVERFLKIYT